MASRGHRNYERLLRLAKLDFRPQIPSVVPSVPHFHSIPPTLLIPVLRYDYTQDPPREVAIKLMNVDDVDYQANTIDKDESISDVRKEIQVLMQLKNHSARNVNLIYDVLEVDGHLWIVCEYCSGGSLRTLVSLPNFLCDERSVQPFSLITYFSSLLIANFLILTRGLLTISSSVHLTIGVKKSISRS